MAKTLKYPQHDWGLNKTFKGRFVEENEDGYVFNEVETGKLFTLKKYARITEALNQLSEDEKTTLLEFEYEGNGEFTINAPDLE